MTVWIITCSTPLRDIDGDVYETSYTIDSVYANETLAKKALKKLKAKENYNGETYEMSAELVIEEDG
jgi:hypothetical protein